MTHHPKYGDEQIVNILSYTRGSDRQANEEFAKSYSLKKTSCTVEKVFFLFFTLTPSLFAVTG